jgi:hypothetical protein
VRIWRACLAAVALFAAPLHAQTTPPEPDPGEIEVRGQRIIDKAIVAENLAELTTRTKALDVVPRFFAPLCLHVIGPDAAANRVIGERIMMAATDVGLKKPEPKCLANALVLIVDQPDLLFDKLLQRRHDVLGAGDRDVHVRRLRDDLAAGRPAIVWNRTRLIPDGGISFVDNGTQIVAGNRATRIQGSIYRSKILSVVVFDSTRLGAATPTQLGDFAALHLLGGARRYIDFERVTARTILSLFAADADLAPDMLTEFDQAYLRGLYSLGRNAGRARVNKAVLDAYEAQCADPEAECQFVVAESELSGPGAVGGGPD